MALGIITGMCNDIFSISYYTNDNADKASIKFPLSSSGNSITTGKVFSKFGMF